MNNVPPMTIERIGYCENCGGANRLKLTINGEPREVECLCSCEADKIEEEELERKRQAERMRKLQKLSKTFGRSDNIPSFEACDGDTNERVFDACRNYVERFKKLAKSGSGLLLYGSPDQGKTFYAECIAEALHETHSVRVISAPEYVQTCQEALESRLRHDIYSNCDLLILDDIGAQRDTSFALECIFELVNKRYLFKLPTIVTTNLTPKQMMNPETQAEHRIYSRILERCLPIQVESGRKRVTGGRYDQIKAELGL